jgi:cytidine deaminase
VRTRGGKLYVGCNVENATSGLTLCAERVALFSAFSDDETEIEAIAVIVRDGKPALPCGICRELIRERAPDARLVLADADGSPIITTLDELLPPVTEEPSR